MNSTVAKLLLFFYFIIFIAVFNYFYQNPEDLYNNIGGGSFGHFLAPLPVILMDLIYAFFITNFSLFLVNTFFALRVQIFS